MKILFLVSSMNSGGAERVAATLCNAWAGQGRKVVLMPTFGRPGPSFYLLDEAVQLDWLVEHQRVRSGLLAWPAKLHALRQRIVAHQPDVVVSFLTNVNVNALLATWGLSVPVIVCERTNPRFSRSSGRVLSWLRKLTYPRARVVSAQTDDAATMLQHDLGLARKPAVLPNPMPPALVDQKPASLEPDAHGRMRLLALGRLVPQKQFDRLITAFGNLASDFPDWDLWIWGEGSQREALNAQVAQAGLNGRVLLPGRTTQPWAEMQQATAFALTSRVEGFPNGLLEAMACGLPCVAFDCPSGPAELLEGGHAGELVPLNDMARLEDALRRMLVNPEHRQQLGRAGRDAVLRRYALPAVLGLWDDVFVEMGVRP